MGLLDGNAESWQELCLAFASWPEVVGLSICGLVLKKITTKKNYEISAF